VAGLKGAAVAGGFFPRGSPRSGQVIRHGSFAAIGYHFS